jgi:hypothetical protein
MDEAERSPYVSAEATERATYFEALRKHKFEHCSAALGEVEVGPREDPPENSAEQGGAPGISEVPSSVFGV